jgi:prepilin-type N-terminal cleavage/methylation domain-containing protein
MIRQHLNSCHIKHISRQNKRSLQSGLTLIELLVSLVILGFVVTIMSGAFYQVAQVVRVAEKVNGEFQPQWVRLNALTDLVANLAMPAENRQPFTGNSESFDGFSLSLPLDDWGNVQAFTVKITPTKQGEGSQLTVTGADQKPVVVAVWNTPMLLEYLAVDGSIQSNWPPFGKTVDLMPSGIVVREVAGEQSVQLVASYTGPRNLEADERATAEALFGVDLSGKTAPGVNSNNSNGNGTAGNLFGVPLP